MSATLDYEIKKALPFLTKDNRWNVLTVLILHANIRNRCWCSMDTIAAMATNGNRTKANDAKKWLEKHNAFELVPFGKRVGAERDLAPRQHVYQLLGKLHACEDVLCDCKADGKEYAYLHFGDDRLNGQTISEGDSLDGQTINRLNGDTFDRLNGQTGSISIEVLPKEKKKTLSRAKSKPKLTPLQKALLNLKPYSAMAAAMLEVLEPGYRVGFHTPETYMTLPHLEDYLPALEYFASKNATPEEIRAMHKYLKPGYDKKDWSIGVKTLVKKLEAFRTWRDNGGEQKIITGVWGETDTPELPDVGLTREQRKELVASTKKAASA